MSCYEALFNGCLNFKLLTDPGKHEMTNRNPTSIQVELGFCTPTEFLITTQLKLSIGS